MSIASDPPIPTPVAPINPEATSAAALLYSPFNDLQMPKPIPVTAPITGIFFRTDLVRDTFAIFYINCFIVVRNILGLTRILYPILVI